MKLWSKEALLLGGIYGILEAPFTYLKCEFITDILFFVFVCCAIMLCFNRTPKFISKTMENYPNISYYLVSIGWIPYFVILGTILFILSDISTLFHIRASVGVLLKHLVTIAKWQDSDV